MAKRNVTVTPPATIVDPVERAKADAAQINESNVSAYTNASTLMRDSFVAILPQGSVALLSYVDTFKGELKGWSAMTMKSQCGAYRRAAIGCADASVAAKLADALGKGQKITDAIKVAEVPTVTNRGRPSNSDKERLSATDTIVEAFGKLNDDQQAVVLGKCFSLYVAKVKKPEARVAIQNAIEAIKAA